MSSKLLSARFWIAIIITLTGCFIAAKKGEMPTEFAAIWGSIVTAYFARSDRKPSGD